ncbi:MAG: FAD-binding oxidoreductase [Propionibacteriaceae bacterium]|jgi:D-amino-acid dehydrogenase|nr:FAD-binding oxidoreductase [Propionibacteriaceae bacterium]
MSVVIIGAGVVGLAAAYELGKRGHKVVLLEKDTYGQGPSHGNAALVTGVLSFPVPAPGSVGVAAKSLLKSGQAITLVPQFSPAYAAFLLRMALATRKHPFAVGTMAQDILTVKVLETFDEYAKDGLVFESHERGSMHVFNNQAEFEAGMSVFEPFADIRSRVVGLETAEAVHEVDPALAAGISYGYYAKTDRQVEPESLMKALVAAIKKQGGELVEHAEVLDFVAKNGKVSAVVTTAGVYEAEQVVIAAGVGSRKLAGMLGFSLPQYSGGGYSVDVHYADYEAGPHTSVLTSASHIAVTPLDWGLRASSGMIIGQRYPEVKPRLIAKLLSDLKATYPGVPLDDVEPGWAGLRPMSADGVPVIGLVPGLSNAYLATGHAMLGLTYAPATAKVLAESMEAERPLAAYELLSPSRFKLRK